MKTSFVFFESFYEAISSMPAKYRLEIYQAICHYALYGEELEMSAKAKALFILMKPNIDASQKKYLSSVENGKKGGRPKKPNQNLNEDADADADVDVDVDVHADADAADGAAEKKRAEAERAASEEHPKKEKETEKEKVAENLILSDGESYPVSMKKAERWQGAYPDLDVMAELRRMRLWLEANPSRRKSKAEIERFIVGWLNKEREKCRSTAPPPAPTQEDANAAKFLSDWEEFFATFPS